MKRCRGCWRNESAALRVLVPDRLGVRRDTWGVEQPLRMSRGVNTTPLQTGFLSWKQKALELHVCVSGMLVEERRRAFIRSAFRVSRQAFLSAIIDPEKGWRAADVKFVSIFHQSWDLIDEIFLSVAMIHTVKVVTIYKSLAIET